MIQSPIYKKRRCWIITKKIRKKKPSPHFNILTEKSDDDQRDHVKVIWDNESTSKDVPHIKIVWDNDSPGNVKILIDGEEKNLKEIRVC